MKKKSMQIISRFGGLTLLAAFALFLNQRNSQTNQEINQGYDEGIAEVHFIDVGQGDSILIEAEDSAMLIDAGENNMGSTVVSYLENHGIEKLDYLIGTHPHSDHIGGLDHVINSIPVEKIIMPEVVHTTNTYEDVLDAILDLKLSIIKPKIGNNYRLGPASFQIIAPNSPSYSELNDYSVGVKFTFQDTSFLLVGDAGEVSEQEMLDSGIDLTADVLKISHHGSEYSTSDNFLDAVDPTHAVISVGKDNEYGHPHERTLKALLDRNIQIYRTDKQRTVVFTTNGSTISANTEPLSENDIIN